MKKKKEAKPKNMFKGAVVPKPITKDKSTKMKSGKSGCSCGR